MAILPNTGTVTAYAYQSDLLSSDGETNLIGAIRASVDPTKLSLGDVSNDPAEGDVTLPVPLVTHQKKRGVWPRHIILSVKPDAATKFTQCKIVILTKTAANAILGLGAVTEPGDITYDTFSGTINLTGYQQEFYIRVFESVQSSSESFRAARAELRKLEQIKEIPEQDSRDFNREYRRRVSELDKLYQEAKNKLDDLAFE